MIRSQLPMDQLSHRVKATEDVTESMRASIEALPEQVATVEGLAERIAAVEGLADRVAALESLSVAAMDGLLSERVAALEAALDTQLMHGAVSPRDTDRLETGLKGLQSALAQRDKLWEGRLSDAEVAIDPICTRPTV